MQSQIKRQKKRGIAPSLTLIAHWNQKWNEHRRIMGDLHKFHQSWLLKEDHHGWFYRFASSIGVGMSSLPTNNGLEGTENMPIEQYIHGIHPPERKSFNISDISCTCPKGIKYEVCKLSLMVMESEKLIDPLPQSLEGRQKKGTKKKNWPCA
uniref:SWIM-type domain-containing protein n=1 Tax=Ditylenchus dipsaci TaxID=166011 RepID=A0A915DIQ1_9BILA